MLTYNYPSVISGYLTSLPPVNAQTILGPFVAISELVSYN